MGALLLSQALKAGADEALMLDPQVHQLFLRAEGRGEHAVHACRLGAPRWLWQAGRRLAGQQAAGLALQGIPDQCQPTLHVHCCHADLLRRRLAVCAGVGPTPKHADKRHHMARLSVLVMC